MKIPEKILELFSALESQPCSSTRVLLDGSITLGVGKYLAERKQEGSNSCFEYEVGSYYKNWKIQSGVGKLDPTEIGVDYSELNYLVAKQLRERAILSVSFDDGSREVELKFQNRVRLKFTPIIDVDDEIFHIRTSEFMYVELHSRHGWRSGDSRTPWPCE